MSHDCEICRGTPPDQWTYTLIRAGLVCDACATKVMQHIAESTLRQIIPKKHWHARTLPPDLPSFDHARDGVYLYGETGSGKSYTLAAILKRAHVHHVRIYGSPPHFQWWDALELLDALRDQRQGPRILQSAYECHRLVIDDIGQERPTEWACERLRAIINHRYNAQLPIDYSSNRDLAHLAGHLTPRDAPDSPVGRGIVSRIAETSRQVHMEGDRRAQIAQERAQNSSSPAASGPNAHSEDTRSGAAEGTIPDMEDTDT